MVSQQCTANTLGAPESVARQTGNLTVEIREDASITSWIAQRVHLAQGLIPRSALRRREIIEPDIL